MEIKEKLSTVEILMFFVAGIMEILDILSDFLFAGELVSLEDSSEPGDDLYYYRTEFRICGYISMIVAMIGLILFFGKLAIVSRNYGQHSYWRNKIEFSKLSLIAANSFQGFSEAQNERWEYLVGYFKKFQRDFVALEALMVAFEDLPQLAILGTYWNVAGGWTGKLALFTFTFTLYKLILRPMLVECRCVLPTLSPEDLEKAGLLFTLPPPHFPILRWYTNNLTLPNAHPNP